MNEWIGRKLRKTFYVKLLTVCQILSPTPDFFFFKEAREKAMAPHSSTLAWKIPWTEEPGGLQSMGSLRVRHDWGTSLSLFTFMHWRRKWQPTLVSCLENHRDRGAWWAAIYEVAQSWTHWSDLAAAADAFQKDCANLYLVFTVIQYHGNPSLCPDQ